MGILPFKLSMHHRLHQRIPHWIRLTSVFGLGLLGASLQAAIENTIPYVYFVDRSQIVIEGSSVTVTVELSNSTTDALTVPFYIESTDAGVVQADSSDSETGDFFISPTKNCTWDASQMTGTFTLGEGESSGSFSFVANDNLVIDTPDHGLGRTVKFRIDQSGLNGKAYPAESMTHQVKIQDNDPVPVTFNTYLIQDIAERSTLGRSVSVSVSVPSPFSSDLTVGYYPEFLISPDGVPSASIDDVVAVEDDEESPFVIDESTSTIISKTITIPAGSTSASAILWVKEDSLSETEEYFQIRMDPGADVTSEYLTVDSNPVEIYITENQTEISPFQVGFSIRGREDEEQERLVVQEHQLYIDLTVRMTETLSQDVIIPITFPTTQIDGQIYPIASRGSDSSLSNDYYIASGLNSSDEISIGATNTSATFRIAFNNDDVEEEDFEDIVMVMGTPRMASGNETPPMLAESSSDDLRSVYTIRIQDNDPVYLQFGRTNPDYDSDVALSPDNQQFLQTNQRTIIEDGNGTAVIPYLTAPLPYDLTFDVTIVGGQTTATAYDPDVDVDEQEWDFDARQGNTARMFVDQAKSFTIIAGAIRPTSLIGVILRDEVEEAWIIGNPLPEDWEMAETIFFEISNPQSEAAFKSVDTTYDLTIRDLPDIDVSGLFDINLLSDGYDRFSSNGLTQIKYDIHNGNSNVAILDQIQSRIDQEIGGKESAIDAADFLNGYRSYKVTFCTALAESVSRKKEDFPANNEHDRIVPTLTEEERDGRTPYSLLVESPYGLRFPTLQYFYVIDEGIEQSNPEFFLSENANIIVAEDCVLQKLNVGPSQGWDVLSPELAEDNERDNYFSVEDDINLTLFFENGGRKRYPVERLARLNEEPEGDRPNNMRLLLSTDDFLDTDQASFISNDQIIHFQPQADGTVFVEINNSNRSPIAVQYMDEDGEWRNAQPGAMFDLGTRLIWYDTGPPTTHKHPGEVNFRLYRFVQ